MTDVIFHNITNEQSGKKNTKTGYTKYNQLTPVESKFSVRNSLIHSTRNFKNHAANAVKYQQENLI